MGLDFVGSVMAAIVADAQDEKGNYSKFVIGCDLPFPHSFWKIAMINNGVPPVRVEDQEVDELIDRCVLKQKTLVTTYNSDCLQIADYL